MTSASTWLTPIISGSRQIGLPLMGTAGLAICIGAFLPTGQFEPSEAVSMPNSGGPLPDWFFPAAITLGSGALFLLFGLFARLRRRRRAADPDDYDEVFEPPPVSPVIGALVLVTTALLVIFAVQALRSGERAAGPLARTGQQMAGEPLTATLPAAGRALTHSPIAGIAVAIVALLAAAAAFAFAWWLHFGGTRLRSASSSNHNHIPQLLQAVDASSDALRFGSDPKAAIIACYEGFERSLAESGLARVPSETANEFAQNASRRFRLPVDAVRDLAHLFELARFSNQPVGEADREAAWRALDAVRAALGAGVDHARTD
ncbi:DUF4129 domain-containing protein [Paraburkholderia sp.]|uniref:DUF4129 domain-containing protein n=1 Tax=Paraburkholderia sp. TaxID=1926495 RepID=UPI0039E6D470